MCNGKVYARVLDLRLGQRCCGKEVVSSECSENTSLLGNEIDEDLDVQKQEVSRIKQFQDVGRIARRLQEQEECVRGNTISTS